MLDGTADHAYAYSMILTTLDDDPVEIEAWFRGRVSIEDRIRDAKLGFGLRHLPSGKDVVNQLWLLPTSPPSTSRHSPRPSSTTDLELTPSVCASSSSRSPGAWCTTPGERSCASRPTPTGSPPPTAGSVCCHPLLADTSPAGAVPGR